MVERLSQFVDTSVEAPKSKPTPTISPASKDSVLAALSVFCYQLRHLPADKTMLYGVAIFTKPVEATRLVRARTQGHSRRPANFAPPLGELQFQALRNSLSLQSLSSAHGPPCRCRNTRHNCHRPASGTLDKVGTFHLADRNPCSTPFSPSSAWVHRGPAMFQSPGCSPTNNPPGNPDGRAPIQPCQAPGILPKGIPLFAPEGRPNGHTITEVRKSD